MASVIKLKRSSTSGIVPSDGALQQGELAINLADKKLFSSSDGNDIITISGDQYNLITQANTSHGSSGGAVDLQLTVDNQVLSNDVISLIGSDTIAITRNANGSISFDASDVPQTFSANSGTASPVNEVINIVSGTDSGVTVTATGSTITVSGTDATNTSKGVASFPSAQFTVSSGAVTVIDATNSVKGVASFASADFDVSSGQVSIKDGSITNAYLANSSIDFELTDSGDVQAEFDVDLSEKLQIDVGEGLDISQAGNGAIVIAGENATTTNKGIASFDTDDFSVTSGAVSLKNSADGAVLVVTGTTNEIEVSRVNGTVTVGLPDDVTVSGQFNVSENAIIAGNTSIGGSLVVDGDLTVEGAVTYISSSTVNIDDTMLKLAANNVADTTDHGVYAMYVDGVTTKYAGYFRDSSDGSVFKFYKDLETEPSATVDTSATGYTLAQVDAVIDGGTF